MYISLRFHWLFFMKWNGLTLVHGSNHQYTPYRAVTSPMLSASVRCSQHRTSSRPAPGHCGTAGKLPVIDPKTYIYIYVCVCVCVFVNVIHVFVIFYSDFTEWNLWKHTNTLQCPPCFTHLSPTQRAHTTADADNWYQNDRSWQLFRS